MRRWTGGLVALAAIALVSFFAARLLVGGPEEATSSPPGEPALTEDRTDEHNRRIAEEASKAQFTGQMGPFYLATKDKAEEMYREEQTKWQEWCGGVVDWDSPRPSDTDFYYTFPDGSLPTAFRCPNGRVNQTEGSFPLYRGYQGLVSQRWIFGLPEALVLGVSQESEPRRLELTSVEGRPALIVKPVDPLPVPMGQVDVYVLQKEPTDSEPGVMLRVLGSDNPVEAAAYVLRQVSKQGE